MNIKEFGKMRVMDVRDAFSSGKATAEQHEELIKFLTNGFDADKFDRKEEQGHYYVTHREEAVRGLTNLFEGLSTHQLANLSVSLVRVANRVFLDYYDDAESYYDSASDSSRVRSKHFVSLVNTPVQMLKTTEAQGLRDVMNPYIRNLYSI